MSLSEHEKAYIAGFVDGEGYIGMYRYKSTANFVPVMQIGNTNRPVLEWIHSKIKEGRITSGSSDSKHVTWKKGWHLQIYNPYNVLKSIIPYLRLKKQQACLLIEYMDRNPLYGIDLHTIPIPIHILEQRRFFYNLLKALNKKGK